MFGDQPLDMDWEYKWDDRDKEPDYDLLRDIQMDAKFEEEQKQNRVAQNLELLREARWQEDWFDDYVEECWKLFRWNM